MISLFKLTDAYNGEFIYVNMDKLISITQQDTTAEGGALIKGVQLLMEGNIYIVVRESVAEIAALAEGRDVAPAKILFGENNK